MRRIRISLRPLLLHSLLPFLFLAPLALFLIGCGPKTGHHKLYDWPTGPNYYCGPHTVTLPITVVKHDDQGVAFIDTVVRDRCLDAIKVQVAAFECDEHTTLAPVCIGVTDQPFFPWCGALASGGWEWVDHPEFSRCILNTIGDYENVWPVYHELHHVVFHDPNHQDPRWVSTWNPRMNELAAILRARPYPPGVDPNNH